MISHLTLLLLLQLAGEALARGAGLPVPGPILGLLMLLALFAARQRLAERLRPTNAAILSYMSLLFVPAGVGIVGHLGLLADEAVPLLVTLVASTVLALLAAAVAFAAVAQLTGPRDA
ncbi:CidA/LrgA family protein [Cereibacter sphaeroides]|uniref:CidA/LrgA family protein n=1 Tax=Cereibacter sphaeroides TaxID=1063 RepID=A0AAX1UII5_CERSP|nr:CidA/LrgA family protein [Cereibacter sphaeroides]RHZ93113.1 CidA/LrgA family protein [Cereibacter sphaeroides]